MKILTLTFALVLTACDAETQPIALVDVDPIQTIAVPVTCEVEQGAVACPEPGRCFASVVWTCGGRTGTVDVSSVAGLLTACHGHGPARVCREWVE